MQRGNLLETAGWKVKRGNVAENDGLSTIALLTGTLPSFAEAPVLSSNRQSKSLLP